MAVAQFRERVGPKGDDGKSFNWEEHADKIEQLIAKNMITFDDLTPVQQELLRGRKGKKGDKGDPGKDGKDGITRVVYGTSGGGGAEKTLPIRQYSSGKLSNFEPDDFHLIDCCHLPIDEEKEFSLGELNGLCN